MQLFVSTLFRYVREQLEHAFISTDAEKREVRLFIQSLPLSEAKSFFTHLENFFAAENPLWRREFRVAKGLWDSWQANDQPHLLTSFNMNWVDGEDKLTFYRNQTRHPDEPGLAVILVGLQHATDKGGLSDFHVVDEDVLWERYMKRSYHGWASDIIQQTVDPDDTRAASTLEAIFDAIFRIHPKNLLQLSRFVDQYLWSAQGQLKDPSEVLQRAYAHLPAWGIPPVLDASNYFNPKLIRAIGEGFQFISHRRFQTLSERRKAIEKLETALSDEDSTGIDVPAVCGAAKAYTDKKEYVGCLVDFIRMSDQQAKERLVQTDIQQVLALLRKKKIGRSTEPSVRALDGHSDTVFLQAVWETSVDFLKRSRAIGQPVIPTEIRISVDRFFHDLEDEGDTFTGVDPTKMLLGCLGGIQGDGHGNYSLLPEELELLDSEVDCTIPVRFRLDLDQIGLSKSNTRPRVEFSVTILAEDPSCTLSRPFAWLLPAVHAERIRLRLAYELREKLRNLHGLPYFKIGTFNEIFFAADESEANRLLLWGMAELQAASIFDGVSTAHVDAEARLLCSKLFQRFNDYLRALAEDGAYAALRHVDPLRSAFEELVNRLISGQATGSHDLIRRVYRAFLAVPPESRLQDDFLRSAIALPVSPFVLELWQSRVVYLRQSFEELARELFLTGGDSVKAKWERLLGLVELRRPLNVLVTDPDHRLSTVTRAHGLLHCLGRRPEHAPGLASQSIMRDDEIDDEVDVDDLIKATSASKIYERVLGDYLRVHPNANDQLNILVANVKDIEPIVAGIHRFLLNYLDGQSAETNPYQVYVKLITTQLTPVSAVNKLLAWRDRWQEEQPDDKRRCTLRIGHRHANGPAKLAELVKEEWPEGYDLAFLTHFLEDQNEGDEIDEAPPFRFDYSMANLSLFPITEYPRPCQDPLETTRRIVISNRRIQYPTWHAELSAKLRHPTSSSRSHLVLGRIDYRDWQPVVDLLHEKAQWVVCVDRYIDRRLVELPTTTAADSHAAARKIVGSSCGLGLHGELNLTVSSEINSPAKLDVAIRSKLRTVIPQWQDGEYAQAALSIIQHTQDLVGLSLLKATGGEYIRNLIAYAIVQKLMGQSAQPGELFELIPLDSFRHWFDDRVMAEIPDLLAIRATVRNGQFELDATVIECKVANYSEQHADKAYAQLESGLRQLSRIFLPNGTVSDTNFDRRYWWAQLHRALVAKAVVVSNADQNRELNAALEALAEGYFTIHWRCTAFTFWTDVESVGPKVEQYSGQPSLDVPLKEGPGTFRFLRVETGRKQMLECLSADQVNWTVPQRAPISFFSASSEQRATATEPATSTAASSSTENESHQAGRESQAPFAPPAEDSSERCLGANAPANTEETSAERERVADCSVTSDQGGLSAASIPLSEIRVLLGNDRNGRPIYWEFGHPLLRNRHMLIFGGSGSGKTYAIQCILAELAKCRQSSLIVDYTNGFLPGQLEAEFNAVACPQSHFVIKDPLPINPFAPQVQIIDGLGSIQERTFNVASRVTSVFTAVYSTIGENQRGTLVRLIEAGLDANPGYDLEDLLTDLETAQETSLVSKLSELIKSRPFGPENGAEGWGIMLNDPAHRVQILQLTAIAKDIQKLITEFALWDLYAYAMTTGNKNRPVPIVLDEIQNLDHKDSSPLDKLLREGRKFGIATLMATQTIANFSEEARSRLFQAEHKLFFKPAETELKQFAKLLTSSSSSSRKVDDWETELSRLQMGECWSVGPRLTEGGELRSEPIKIRIAQFGERTGGTL